MIFILGMILTSSIFRFIMVDENFVTNDMKRLKKDNVADFVFSKNIFVLVGVLMIFLLVTMVNSFFIPSFFTISFFLKLMIYILFTLGSEIFSIWFIINPLRRMHRD